MSKCQAKSQVVQNECETEKKKDDDDDELCK